MKTVPVARAGRQALSTKRLVVAALLVAITIFLAYSPIGMIPLPPPLTNATTVHIPVLLGVVLEGPWLGLLLGLTFGVCSLLIAISSPAVSLTFFFRDPLVSILPRLLFPLIAWGVLWLWRRFVTKGKAAERVGVGVAAVVGSLMNTVLCLGAIVVLHGAGLNELVNNFIKAGGANSLYLDQAGAWLVAVVGLPYGLSEAVVAAVLVPAVYTALAAINRRGGRGKAAVPKANETDSQAVSLSQAPMPDLAGTAPGDTATAEAQAASPEPTQAVDAAQ